MNKRVMIIILFVLLVINVGSAFSDGRKIEKEILNCPDVLRISKMVRQNDWDDKFDVYIEMKDGVKIILWSVEFVDKNLKFYKLIRIGDFSPASYKYNIKLRILNYTKYIFFYPAEKSDVLHNTLEQKNVMYLLANYCKVLEEISHFEIINEQFENIYRAHKHEEAFELLKYRIKTDNPDIIIGYFNYDAESTSWSRWNE